MGDHIDWQAEGVLWRHPGELNGGAAWSERVGHGPLHVLVNRAMQEPAELWRYSLLMDDDVNHVVSGMPIAALAALPDFPKTES
jgi:hypothetical protein